MTKRIHLTDETTERLIEAIVVRAANDYRGLFIQRLYGR